MNSIQIDRLDRRILDALQQNGKIPNTELADRVGLSPSATLRRVKLLEENGYIKQYIAILDPEKLDLSLTIFIRVWFRAQDEGTTQRFIDAVQNIPEIVECHIMAGDCDALLKAVVKDLKAYRKMQATYLGTLPEIVSMKTDIPMQTEKYSYALPI